MPTIKLAKQYMLDALDDPALVVRDRITDLSRWSVNHELIFRHEGGLYRAFYRVGATEMQEESPWEYSDEVEATEMREVPSTDFEPVT